MFFTILFWIYAIIYFMIVSFDIICCLLEVQDQMTFKRGLRNTFRQGLLWPIYFFRFIFKALKKGWDLEK